MLFFPMKYVAKLGQMLGEWQLDLDICRFSDKFHSLALKVELYLDLFFKN